MQKSIVALLSLLTILSLPAVSSTAVAATAVGPQLQATATVSGKCVVSATTNVAFGLIDPTTDANYDGTGTIVTKCSKNTSAFIFITPTVAGPLAMRSITTNDSITYGLYNESGRTTAFPSAAGGAKTSQTGASRTTTVFGRVVVGNNVNDAIAAADNYTQALTATIEW